MARKRRRHASKAHKICIVQSGPKKGKLKKGWHFGKNGNCLRAKKG